MLLSIIFVLGAWAGADNLPPTDDQFACTDLAAANRYISGFGININSFGGRELCNATVDSKKLFNDLEVVERGEFEGDKTNVFIRNMVNRTNYYSWLKAQTRGVRRGHDVPWATAYNSGGYFTMQDGWTKLSTLGRVGTIIHEARHTEGYFHISCDHGPYADSGLSGCDSSIEQTGSHGVEMEYYSRVVLQGKNFHPVYKAMARLMNLGRANFVFNELPMETTESLVAVSGPRTLIMNSKDQVETPTPNVGAGFKMKRTSFGASLYNGVEAYALDFYAADHGDGKVSDDYSYYKLLKMPFNVPAVDIEELDKGDQRYLISINAQGQVRSFVFPEAQWSDPVTVSGGVSLSTLAPDGAQGLFVVKSDGSLCAFDVDNMSCGSSLKEKWPADVESYALYEGQLLKLGADGVVTYLDKGTPFEKLNGIAVEQMISVPVWDAFEL